MSGPPSVQRLILEDFLNSYFMEHADRIRNDADNTVLVVPKDGPASAEMVEVHWQFALGYFASTGSCMVPTMKAHQDCLIVLAKRYGIFQKVKGYGRTLKDWAVKQAPPIRCLFVHALRLCRRSSSSKSLKIKMLKESMEVIISASGLFLRCLLFTTPVAGESPHDGIEAALANASLQDGDEQDVSTPSSCSATPPSVVKAKAAPMRRYKVKAPQAPNPDEMETQQLVDDLEKLMNDDLMCDDATPEVAVDPKVDGYRRQAAKEMHCMEAIPPEMPDKTDLEMTELMENPPDAYQAQLVAEKAKKIQHAEQLLKNAQSDGKVKNKFSKPGRGRGKGRGRGRAVDNSVADPKPSEPAGESNGNDPTPEPEGGGSGSGEPAGGDPNIEVAPKKGRNHLTQSELQKMWSEKAPLLRAAAIPVPADFDPTSKKSFTLPPPDDKKCGSVGILWTLDQIYVSAVTNKEADESIRVNKKGGSTLSIRKKGWAENFTLAKKLAGW
ncbi:unnamed protein product [Cladocopium goreaui]|uniref:Uncharacterized protein n=1 Tax=Cladocopium goreaui TaxID=2562237 RepID=A0A9P1FHW4_9DINO|nr:unnamed protein product [Cladocopium goreaui]